MYDNQGHIITNYYVVDAATKADVTFTDGNTYSAKVIGKDPNSDLAVLQITDNFSEEKVVPIPMANSSNVRTAEQVIAIGNPFGLSGTITTGLVSQQERLLPNTDDCSRKVVSKWCERRSTKESFMVLKEWMRLYGNPKRVMHDGGREFIFNKFKDFLRINGIKDKQIPKGYPQEQEKVEAYISEFLEVEQLLDEKDGAQRYDAFVNSYNYEREHGGINGMTPAEKFMKCLKQPILTRQKVSVMLVHLFVNHVWKYNT